MRLQLRWRDIDMLGHLNQSVYHELLEEARGGLIGKLVRRLGPDQTRGGFVLAHVDLDYHSEVRRDHEQVDVCVRVTRVGSSSVTLEHQVRLPDGVLAASGTTVLVAWDPATRAKRPLTDAERAALS